jgi:predicted amidohydrolase YtcJ
VDVILTGGSIITMAGQHSPEAVGVDRGRIAAVGALDEVLAKKRPSTEVIDLRGKALLPGLIDPHTHPDLCAQVYGFVDVSGFTHSSVTGVEAALRKAIRNAPPGQWIFAFGLDPMLTPDVGVWDRARLDAIAPAHPLAVMIQSMHSVFVNSLALSLAGIGDDTPDPAGGGRFQRDANGRLTGKLEETPAIEYVFRFTPRSFEATQNGLREQYRRYARAGLTTLGVAGTFAPAQLLEQLAGDPSQPVRLVTYLRQQNSADRPADGPDSRDRYRVRGLKLWYDGSPYTGTMLVDEAYLDSPLCRDTLGIPPGSRGHSNFAGEDLRDLLLGLHREGWQVMTHAQGDRATREILDLYEGVLTSHHRPDHRWRIEHCALIGGDSLARAARLGVAVSFHLNHVYYYGPELRESILGPERAEALMPVGTAVRLGHRVSLHADSPMYPPEPLRLVRTAVTRLTRNGDQIAPREAITLDQALRAVTIDAAWQLFAEDEVGSIETGKRADFTVLEQNPFEVAPADVDRIAVAGTWLDGRPTNVSE